MSDFFKAAKQVKYLNPFAVESCCVCGVGKKRSDVSLITELQEENMFYMGSKGHQ